MNNRSRTHPRPMYIIGMLWLASATGLAQQAESVDSASTPAARRLAIIRLQHMPAVDVAQVIVSTMLANNPNESPVAVHAEPVGNSLVINAPPAEIQAITHLVEQLDVPQPLILVDVTLVQLHAGADKPDLLRAYQDRLLTPEDLAELRRDVRQESGITVMARPNLMVLSNQPGFVRLAKAAEDRDLKLTLAVTAGATPQGRIVMEFDIDVASAEDEHTLLQTSVGLPSGHGVIVADLGIVERAAHPSFAVVATAKFVE